MVNENYPGALTMTPSLTSNTVTPVDPNLHRIYKWAIFVRGTDSSLTTSGMELRIGCSHDPGLIGFPPGFGTIELFVPMYTSTFRVATIPLPVMKGYPDCDGMTETISIHS